MKFNLWVDSMNNMEKIDITKSPRKKTYDWFKTFNNPTYGLTVTMDVTSLVEYTKKNNQSFLSICYILL